MAERIDVVDVVIPTCKAAHQVGEQIAAIVGTAGMPVRVFATCTPGSAAENRNIALDNVHSDVCVMLDDDICDFVHGWAASMVRTFRQRRDAGCVMVSAQLYQPGHVMYAFMMGLHAGVPGLPPGSPPTVLESSHLLTACIVIPKDSLRFNEDFIGSGFEDSAYCDLQNKHYPGCHRVVDHDARVVHRNEMKNQREHWEKNRRLYAELATKG